MGEDDKKPEAEPVEYLPVWQEAWFTVLLLVYIVVEPVDRWWNRRKRRT